MKKTTLPILAVVVLLGAPRVSPAQQDSPAGSKPMVTVAFSGYDEILKDIEAIGTLAGNPQLGQMVQGMAQQSPAGEALAGIDTKRPWGFVVKSGADQFPMFGFVPVTDLKKVLAALPGEPSDAGDGVMEIQANNQTMYVQEKEGGWAFIAKSPDILANTPADPVQLLDGLHEQYDLAVRVSVSNVPPMLRQTVMGPVQMGLQMGMQQQPGESAEQHALRTKAAKQAIEQFQTLLNELEVFQVGLAIDRSAKTAYLEYLVEALEGTNTAKQMAQNTEAPSKFAGFALPDAAVTLNMVSKVTQADIDQMKATLAPIRTRTLKELEGQALPPDRLEEAKRLVGDLFDVLESTIDTGRVDVGTAVLLDPDTLTFATGARVGDSAKLDSLIKDLAKQVIEEQPNAADAIQLDAEEHQGVRFHLLKLPTAELAANFPNLPRLVGDTLNVVIGVGPEAAYLAGGRDALATLKTAIDQSKTQAGEPILPMRVVVSATPIAKFVAAVAEDQQAKGIATMVAGLLEQAGDQDHLTVTSTPIPNGAKVRVEFEEGLLKVIGSLPTMMAGPGAAGP